MGYGYFLRHPVAGAWGVARLPEEAALVRRHNQGVSGSIPGVCGQERGADLEWCSAEGAASGRRQQPQPGGPALEE